MLRVLRVSPPSPSGLLQHLLVLVLAHLLAPLLDYRAQSISLITWGARPGCPRTQKRRLRVRGAKARVISRRGSRRRMIPQAAAATFRPTLLPMYFTDAHEELRLHIRKFLTTEVQPHLEEWEEKTFPDSIFKRFGELGEPLEDGVWECLLLPLLEVRLDLGGQELPDMEPELFVSVREVHREGGRAKG